MLHRKSYKQVVTVDWFNFLLWLYNGMLVCVMCVMPVINLYKLYCFFLFCSSVCHLFLKFSIFSYFHYTKTSEDAVAHDWILSFLFLFSGLTVQPTKSGKSAVWLLCTLVLYLLRCEHASCAGGEMQQQDWPCCHPTCPDPPTLHVTQICGFVHQPRCLNTLYIWRGQQWIQLQAMECHCLLLLDNINIRPKQGFVSWKPLWSF